MNRRSFTKLLLPALSLGLIKLGDNVHQQYCRTHEFSQITYVCKKCGITKEEAVFGYCLRNNLCNPQLSTPFLTQHCGSI